MIWPLVIIGLGILFAVFVFVIALCTAASRADDAAERFHWEMWDQRPKGGEPH